MIVALVAASALAQSVTIDAGNALEPAAGTFYERGVGAPTVAWDPIQARYIMLFETQLADADANCTSGYWGIGVANSVDGYTWEVWPDPVVSPTAGTPWACYAAHPAIVRDDAGTYHVWFKAGQGLDACSASTPAWGCALEAGIGKVSGIIELDDKSDEIAAKEAELAAIQDAIDAEHLDIQTAVDDFLAYLELTTALDCVNYADICAPCESLTLSATRYNTDVSDTIVSTTLCQPFDFNTPLQLPVVEGSAGKNGFAYLKFGIGAATSSCKYKGGSNAQFAPYNQEIAIGQCADVLHPTYIELVISRASNNYPATTVEITLTATNAQLLQGPGLDTLVALSDSAALGDRAGVHSNGNASLTVLANLRAELASLPSTPERADLDAEAAALEALLNDALANLTALEADEAAVQAELDALYAYTRQVSLSGSGASLVLTRASYPSVALVAGEWVMQVAYKRNIWTATSTDGENFTLFAAPSIKYGTVSWSQDELFTPALTCGDAAGFERYQSIYGGRDTSNNIPGGGVVEGGLGEAISADLLTWLTNVTPWTTWYDDQQWRHFDVLHDGGERRFWLSELDATGKSVIRTASTGPVSTSGGTGRVCQ